MIDAFIEHATHGKNPTPVVTFDGKALFDRYNLLWRDEWPDSWWDEHRERWLKAKEEERRPIGKYDYSKRPNALPWWRPFNAFLHHWNPDDGSQEGFHDHPRWSITVCLKGQITEVTPWGERLLKPGSIVIRSRKAIHAFRIEPEFAGKTWTLFIVGRRKCRQNTFVVTKR